MSMIINVRKRQNISQNNQINVLFLTVFMSSEQKGRRNRRTKSQMNKETQEYVCPCGKVYYSYTALYTHIKQQHNNEAPGPIKRPAKNQNRIIGASKIDHHNKILKIKSELNPFAHLTQSLKQYTQNIPYQKLIHQFYGSYDVVHILLHPQQQKYKKKKQNEEEPEININKGIQKMIKQCEQYGAYPAHTELLVVVSAILIEYIIRQTEDQTVLQKGGINLLIQYSNYYLVTSYKRDMEKYQAIGEGWLGNITNFMKILAIIFQWLLFKQYTLTKVEFNMSYSQNHIQQHIDAEKNNASINKTGYTE